MTPELNRIHEGDVLEVLRSWPAEFVHTIVTSPPYFGLRDYGTATWEGGDPSCDHKLAPSSLDKKRRARAAFGAQNGHASGAERLNRKVCRCGAVRRDRQVGLEDSLDEYVAKIVEIGRELRRVLRPDGTFWLNIGDSYAGSWGAQGRQGTSGQVAGRSACAERQIAAAAKRESRTGALDKAPGLKSKDLMMVPARVALALQADGWWLRSKITWAKAVSFRPDFCGTCMPESAEDRPTNSSEEIFLFAKRERYFYDAEAVKEKGSIDAGKLAAKGSKARAGEAGVNGRPPSYWEYTGRRNLRSVWAINPEPFKGAHYATFPPTLPDVCIRAGTSEKGACSKCGAPVVRVVKKRMLIMSGDGRHVPGVDQVAAGAAETGYRQESKWVTETETIGWRPSCRCDAGVVPCVVLDPFMGAGTTALAAARRKRDFVGIELNPDNVALGTRRVRPEIEQGKLFG